MSVLLYNTPGGPRVRIGRAWYAAAPSDWDELLNTPHLAEHLRDQATPDRETDAPTTLFAPAVGQEVWGAGVTYYRSRVARREESKEAGGGDFYDRVYAAERPEVFFKATPQRLAPPGGELRLRRDSHWIVP